MSPQSLSIAKVGEIGLIDMIRAREVLPSRVICGIGDDAAAVRPASGKVQLIATDMLIEGTHFEASVPPALLGRKALAVNLSDIAAMGGKPTVAVVALGLGLRVTSSYVKELYRGMRRLAKSFDVTIVGGDTVRSPVLTMAVTLLGEANARDIVRRDGARPGDTIYVTGKLGGSFASGRHLTFVPRVKEGQWLARRRAASAMMDISDGLLSDLDQLIKASGQGAVLYEEKIPRHPGVSLEAALTDGEDFELVLTARPGRIADLEKKGLPFKVYPVGEILDSRSVKVLDRDGREIVFKTRGYQHFGT